MNKYEILKKYFGYDSLREGQEGLIDALLRGQDVLQRRHYVHPAVKTGVYRI